MGDNLEKSIVIECSVEHAFETFVEKIDLWWPRGHRKFEKSKLSLDARIGGRFLEISDDGNEAVLGAVIDCQKPSQISYTWFPGSIELPTLVEILFRPQDDATLVEVTHSEADSQLGEAWPQRVTIFSRSWDTILSSVKTYIETKD